MRDSGEETTVSRGANEALRVIAEGATALAGFEIAAISVVREGCLQTVAVAGDRSAADALEGLRTPVRLLLAELERAEVWGRLRFVAHERSPGALAGFDWVPPIDAVDDRRRWHPEDLLCGLLHDDEGTLQGVLSVDLPRDRRRPARDELGALEVYVKQAERAIVTSLERDELQRGIEHVRELAEYRRQLVGSVSHELQNPLAAITGHIEMLQEAGLSQGQESSVGAIGRAATRLRSLVDDLLLLARLDDSTQEPPLELVDLGAQVLAAVEALRDDAERTHVRITYTADAAPQVLGRATDLLTTAHNLVSNAVKYSEPGDQVGVRVVEVRRPDGEHRAVISVVDDGIGIDEASRSRVFEEFYRSEANEVRQRSGTGLGLAIVARIVRRHGGSIRLTSEVGRGTTVEVGLPVAVGDS